MLSDITILIPTFHRRGYLEQCLDGIRDNLPECKVVITSDDGQTPSYYAPNNRWIMCSYDAGLTLKRNVAVEHTHTPYALMGSDDFDFSTPEVRKGIIEMALALKYNPEADVVVGRYKDRDYHGFLEYMKGFYIKEYLLNYESEPDIGSPVPLWKVDIGPNYFLARTKVLRDIPWDETIRPIGGEHADWFLDLKEAGKTVMYLPFANINELPKDRSKEHPSYREFRNRCWEGHALFMKKRGIKKYYGFNEEIQGESK